MSIRSQMDFSIETSRLCSMTVSLSDRFNWSTSHTFTQESSCVLTYEFDDTFAMEHFLTLNIDGKKNNFENSDVMVMIKNIILDDVDVTRYYQNITLPYYHDSNGFGPMGTHIFSTNLGCDGRIDFSFVSPVYQWIRHVYVKSRFQ